MDGLSAAASIIAVADLSVQVFEPCSQYYLSVRDARKHIFRLQTEVAELSDVLQKVADLHKESAKLPALEDLSKPGGTLAKCRSELRGIEERLAGAETMRKFGARALRWPFSEKEVDKLITTLSRDKDSLMLAMVTDQMWVPQERA